MKKREKLSVTMAAPSEKCVFVNGAGCEADVAALTELLVHFAALRIPFCVNVEIREQTISIISSQ